jgi:GTP-binding protein HflX
LRRRRNNAVQQPPESLIGTLAPATERRRALLVGVERPSREAPAIGIDESMQELEQLVRATGDEVVGCVTQNLDQSHPVTYVGKGKLADIRDLKAATGFDAVIADDELSPTQQRRLEDELEVEVADRTAVILHLFAQHARTREGKLQVELAQYRYRLPRLTGRGVELSRLGAGINTRGPGETKLETDRRRIRSRIATLNRALDDVRAQRSLHRRQRSEAGLPVFALAGYTNAGKSTLMNALTSAGVLSSNVLFATLDPTTRQLELPNRLEVLMTDTVGFIQKLPADLVAAFRATLEELQEADCIIHVLDASHANMRSQAATVESELGELDVASKPRITVLNKIDLVEQERVPMLVKSYANAVAVSARTGDGLQALGRRMAELVSATYVRVKVRIPYSDAEVVHLFHRRGVIDREDHRAGGTVIAGRLPKALLTRFQEYVTE